MIIFLKKKKEKRYGNDNMIKERKKERRTGYGVELVKWGLCET